MGHNAGADVAGDVDYRLARNMVVSEFHKGRLSRLDICDAHPELLRAATNVGEETREDCPICEEAKVRLVSYVFGSRLPAVRDLRDLAPGARSSWPKGGRGLTCYVVEVCPSCSWNHLARSFTVAHPAASLGRSCGLRLRAPPNAPGREPPEPARRRGGPAVALAALAVRDRLCWASRWSPAVCTTCRRIPLPTPGPLEQTTFVYDSSGQHVLASFSEQNRVEVSLAQVPQVVINAVVSTEDRHFFSEGALNPVSIVRAFIADVRGSGNLQGASTITQQYVKQTYLSSQRSLSRKIKEAALAIRLARSESKREILQNYLNTIYWGRGAYGVEAAAEAYFGKNVEPAGPARGVPAGRVDPGTRDRRPGPRSRGWPGPTRPTP